MDVSSLQQTPPLQENEGFKHSPLELCLEGQKNQSSLEDLPIPILCLIFSKTTPRDIARLTVVSRQCGEAAMSHQLWDGLLPAHAKEVAGNAHGGPLVYRSAKDLYCQLVNHVLLGNGTQGYWIDRKTGAASWSFSALALGTIWDYDTQHWRFVAADDARFSGVAELDHLHWLDLAFEMKVKLPPGEYTLAWVLEVENESCGWEVFELSSIYSINGFDEEDMKIKLSGSLTGWVTYNFGHIIVTSDTGDRESLEEVNLEVFLGNYNGNVEMKWLRLDGIIIRSGKFDL